MTLKEKRLQLLNRETHIRENHCFGCETRKRYKEGTHPDKVCGGCDQYKELRAIGKELKGKPRPVNVQPYKQMPFTLEDYQEWRDDNMSQKDIAEMMDITVGRLNNIVVTLRSRARRERLYSETLREDHTRKVSG